MAKSEDPKAKGNGHVSEAAADSDQPPPEKRQKTESAPNSVLEEGQIFFIYRPRVAIEEAKSLTDVQRFYLILQPDSSTKKRLIVIGKKKLPAKGERFFGFVEAVSENMEELTGGMGPVENETKTLGTRRTEPARIAGQGKYTIAEEATKTFLSWKLEVPEEPSQVQTDLGISKEGSISLSIKNPTKPNPGNPNIGLDTKADFGDKQKLFDGTPGGYAWIAAKEPSMLDHLNAELLFIGAGDDIGDTVTEEVEEHTKEQAEQHIKETVGDAKGGEKEEAKLVEELKNELGGDKAQLDQAPVEKKEWK